MKRGRKPGFMVQAYRDVARILLQHESLSFNEIVKLSGRSRRLVWKVLKHMEKNDLVIRFRVGELSKYQLTTAGENFLRYDDFYLFINCKNPIEAYQSFWREEGRGRYSVDMLQFLTDLLFLVLKKSITKETKTRRYNILFDKRLDKIWKKLADYKPLTEEEIAFLGALKEKFEPELEKLFKEKREEERKRSELQKRLIEAAREKFKYPFY